jgi:hypothetical protein
LPWAGILACSYDERNSKLRYPFFSESAWPVKYQNRVYIRYRFLLINSGRALMPSMAFGGGLTGLAKGIATKGHEKKDQRSNNQNHFTY